MNKKSVIVIGNGGHAKVLFEMLHLQGISLKGLSYPAEVDTCVINGVRLPVLASDDGIFDFNPQEIGLVLGIGSISADGKRSAIFKKFKDKNYFFPTIKHPTAIVSSSAELGEGVQLFAGSIIQTAAVIGDNVIVNTGARIDHDVIINKHCHIAPGVCLSGGVRVGENVHIGTGAIVSQGVHIGPNSTIGAGAVVYRDVPAGVTLVGYGRIIR